MLIKNSCFENVSFWGFFGGRRRFGLAWYFGWCLHWQATKVRAWIMKRKVPRFGEDTSPNIQSSRTSTEIKGGGGAVLFLHFFISFSWLSLSFSLCTVLLYCSKMRLTFYYNCDLYNTTNDYRYVKYIVKIVWFLTYQNLYSVFLLMSIPLRYTCN